MKRGIKAALAALIAPMLIGSATLANGVEAQTGQIRSAIVTEAETGQRIFELNADERLDVGGLVRLPALIYVAECIDGGRLERSAEIAVSPDAASIGGATAFLKSGETIRVDTAMKAAVMITAGDAIYALAESCANGAGEAVKEINALLQKEGVFNEVSSIDGKGLLLSAEELARLGARLAKSEVYREFSTLYMDEIVHENGTTTDLVNQNRLIKTLNGCFAGSTGSSDSAKYCGVFMVKRDGSEFIAAVIGAADAKTRTSCAANIIEASCAAVSIKHPVKKGNVVMEAAEVTGGIIKSVDLIAAEDVTLIIWNGDEPRCILSIEESYCAPVYAGSKAGTVEYFFEVSGQKTSVDLLFKEDIEKADILDYMALCFVKWTHG